jgi:subtilisin family serine protease
MLRVRRFTALALALVLAGTLTAGCASSGSTATRPANEPDDGPAVATAAPDTASATGDTDSPPRDTSARRAPSASAPDTSAAAGPTRTSAPRDWYHRSSEAADLPGMGTATAYERLLQDRSPKQTVTVAIIDSGVDIDHEDLDDRLWTNRDEVPGNDKDDDGNGYVDDVHGWNFIGGPDGENVDEDTYELTRIYVNLRERFAGVDSASVAPDEREAYRRYQRIRSTFEEKRREAKKQRQNVQRAYEAMQFASSVMKSHLDTDSLTLSAVRGVSSPSQQVSQAQRILTYFYEQDLRLSDLEEYLDQLTTRLEYNYNPDFNPRSIVGDDYSDKTERIYGNEDVTGPDASHGTHVAGIVGAERDNGVGTKGVANGVQLMIIRAVPNGDERDKDVANAIHYAVDNGADVINMSFGKGYSPHKAVVDAAVQRADSMGVLMVHAAGNDGANVDSTENYPTRRYADGGEADLWIEVGASTWKGGRDLAAPFSNYGDETVDVFAPGLSIYSTVPENRYERNDGTSMASPMVAGLAGMLMAYFPELSPAEVRDIILETATRYDRPVLVPGQSPSDPNGGTRTIPFDRLSRTGAVVNAVAAVERALSTVQ